MQSPAVAANADSAYEEVDTLRRLQHPNILSYYDSFVRNVNDTKCQCATLLLLMISLAFSFVVVMLLFGMGRKWGETAFEMIFLFSDVFSYAPLVWRFELFLQVLISFEAGRFLRGGNRKVHSLGQMADQDPAQGSKKGQN